MSKLTVLDLFSGIGGFSLGLERTGGFETKAFCEIDPFCRRVLAKHWPQVPCFDDVTTLRGEDVGPVDVICGGFPCQDISIAGRQAGIDGARSGLWGHLARHKPQKQKAYVNRDSEPTAKHEHYTTSKDAQRFAAWRKAQEGAASTRRMLALSHSVGAE